MRCPSPSPVASCRPPTALPNAWVCLLGEFDGSGARLTSDTSTGNPFSDTDDVLATAAYADKTFGVLHQVLEALPCSQVGPRLDALAMALQRLSLQCGEVAERWATIDVCPVDEPLTHWLVKAETIQARAVADAVTAVCALVVSHALGELDQCDLNAAWLRLSDALAHPSRVAPFI